MSRSAQPRTSRFAPRCGAKPWTSCWTSTADSSSESAAAACAFCTFRAFNATAIPIWFAKSAEVGVLESIALITFPIGHELDPLKVFDGKSQILNLNRLTSNDLRFIFTPLLPKPVPQY